MGTRVSPGFTIIETMLFLAVTGVLIVAMLVGVGTSLNIQRYRDAVETFKNSLQQEYASLSNVQNSRESSWDCDATATPVTGGSERRGQSECVMVGKYVRIEGSSIRSYQVLARENASGGVAEENDNDIASMRAGYTFNVSTIEVSERTMEWGTQIAWPSAGPEAQSPTTPRKIGILFIRSPDSGQVYTFTSDAVPDMQNIVAGDPTMTNTLNDMLVAGNNIPGQQQRTICVESDGLVVTGDTSISIEQFAATASAIEVQTNEYIETMGGATRC